MTAAVDATHHADCVMPPLLRRSGSAPSTEVSKSNSNADRPAAVALEPTNERRPQTGAAVVCGDDAIGYFQSAVTHFFGNDDDDDEEELQRCTVAPALGTQTVRNESDHLSHYSPPLRNAEARSLSPSFPWCDGSNHSTDAVAHFIPADFSPQTWSAALSLQNASPVHCAGAAVLAAAIVVSPLATIAATAATASAWAVGSYWDLSEGYRIWKGEEFGKLFWADPAPVNGSPSTTVTTGGGAIIQRDQDLPTRLLLPEGRAGTMSRENGVNENFKIVVTLEECSTGEVAAAEKVARGSCATDSLVAELAVSQQPSKEPQLASTNFAPKPLTIDTLVVRKAGLSCDDAVLPPVKSLCKNDLQNEPTSVTDKDTDKPPKQGEKVTFARKKEPAVTLDTNESKVKQRIGEKQQWYNPQSKKQSYSLRRINSAPAKAVDNFKLSNYKWSNGNGELVPSYPVLPRKTAQSVPAVTATTTIEDHFPPLQRHIITVELPGLNAAEFFRVFLADDAPYGFQDFQRQRGDVDVRYGRWADVGGACVCSLKRGNGTDPMPLPSNSTQERTLTFSTLTKSYFGPAYAKAVKTQRVTGLGSSVLVVENKTQLVDIPFADRFCVIERWVVEAVEKREEPAATDQQASPSSAVKTWRENSDVSKRPEAHWQDRMAVDSPYTCRLTVHIEVEMFKSCSWEAQIRKKAYEASTEMTTEWCKSATVALEATERQKRKRLRRRGSGETNSGSECKTSVEKKVVVSGEPALPVTLRANETELLARHQRNFQELDRLIARGDLEWCSIEVLHTPSSDREDRTRPFGQVLEYPLNVTPAGKGASAMVDARGTDRGVTIDISGRKAAATIRGRSRNLLRRLSSRVSKSKLHSR